MKNLKMYAFAALAVIQLAVVANTIMQNERVFVHGTIYRFRCMPVDPYDAFRGRYVSVGIDRNFVTLPAGQENTFTDGQEAYGIIGVDKDGFAHIEGLSTGIPAGDYIKVRIMNFYNSGTRVYFRFPIDRYYMNETAAPKAESAYWSTWRTRQTVYMEVMVLKGDAVMKGLYIDGKPIEEEIKK
jgi:uncharacterized membrane-anchored protein